MQTDIQLSDLKKLGENSFIVTDNNIYGLYKKYLPDGVFVLPDGENAKTLQSVQALTSAMLSQNITKGGVLLAIGGGVIGDLVGFTASVYMRGIDWICVPTTITALADSCIGGKTAVNVGNKNSLGSFHLPKTVYRCYGFLDTLPRTEIANGLVEVFKTALLDKQLFDMVNSALSLDAPRLDTINLASKTDIKDIYDGESDKPIKGVGDRLKDVLRRCADVKQSIVDKDFLDKGERKKLNLGHTVGHALEYLYGFSHGKSVAIGLCAEAFMCGITTPHILEWINKIAKPYFDGINGFDAFNDKGFKGKISLDSQEFSCASEQKIDPIAVTNAALNDKKNNEKISVFAVSDIGMAQQRFFDKQAFCAKLADFLTSHKA